MKIFVKSRLWMIKNLEKNPDFVQGKWIISIFDKDSFSPFLDRFNILKLEFDDVTEADKEEGLLHFNENHAKKIHDFINEIPTDSKKPFYVHCAAGVSRSGAVGYLMNEWFNKFKTVNRIDNEAFQMNNSHIQPNPEVLRVLKKELFGMPFIGIPCNDFTYDQNGEKQDHITMI